MECIEDVLHPPHGISPLAINCDTSTDHRRAAVDCCSGQQCHLAVFIDSQEATHRLTAFNRENMITRNILHICKQSKQGIHVSLYLISSHIEISCDRVNLLAKLALSHKEPYYVIPLSLTHMKKKRLYVIGYRDYEGLIWSTEKTTMVLSGILSFAGTSEIDKPYKVKNGIPETGVN